MSRTVSDLCVVVACNDERVLRRNLLASALVKAGAEVHIVKGAPSASVAYNQGLAATSAPLVLFVHQDVWIPYGWEHRLFSSLEFLDENHKNWALVGPFGMSKDGYHIGDVWSTSLGRRVGTSVSEPTAVQSFDELAFLLKRDSGLSFDEQLKGWHFYGTDIVQSAINSGRSAFVIDAPVVHNDAFKANLGQDFWQGYQFVKRKWKKKLPIRTSILWIKRSGFPFWLNWLHGYFTVYKRRSCAMDTSTSPEIYATHSGIRSLGPEKLTSIAASVEDRDISVVNVSFLKNTRKANID